MTVFIKLEISFCCNVILIDYIKIWAVNKQRHRKQELEKLNPSISVLSVILNAPQSQQE
jgi:hypothetical protein